MEELSITQKVLPVFVYLAIIITCIKDRIKISAGLSLFIIAFYPIIIGFICLYSLPDREIHGVVSPLIAFVIGGVICLISLAIFAPFIPSRSSRQNSEPSFWRWVLLIGSIFSYILGVYGAFMYWYTPRVFGLEEPVAINGVISLNVFALISAVLMYFASRKNSENRPNLMRKLLILVYLPSASCITLALTFVLIYTFPSDIPTSYPNEASYNLISMITLGLLLLIVSKEAVAPEKITS
ncbi:MAG: hypothetical protein OEM02_00090 [Desulfobulbaceae bacterium]|nr:hypothetical protein [Desulfobulbaceae bacterium]